MLKNMVSSLDSQSGILAKSQKLHILTKELYMHIEQKMIRLDKKKSMLIVEINYFTSDSRMSFQLIL